MDSEKHLAGLRVNPDKVKLLFKNLLLAYQRHDHRKKTVETVQRQIERVKEAAVKRAPKKVVEQEVLNLQDMIAAIFDKEKALLAEQREETKLLLELRAKVDDIEKQVLQQSRLSPATSTMQELHTINQALLRLDTKLDEEAARLDQLRTGKAAEKTRMYRLALKERVTERKIMEIEVQLKLIEAKHKQLARKGYGKAKLKKLKTLINKHKRKLSMLKQKKRMKQSRKRTRARKKQGRSQSRNKRSGKS